ncbi:Protein DETOXIFICATION 29 [Trifolium repens]|nr:Protein DETOXIFICATION 29 [Trifolium repens]WJX39712.1 Protein DETOXIFICATION 29 [Trifolium repens]WJX39729.1 Protein DETOXIFICATION 29 [Trifolium repens]
MVLYGTDFVRWISQECRSLCRRLLYLHEYIGLDHHGVFWDECRRKCEKVAELVKDLTPLLALCVVINNVKPILSWVAIGAGWQAAVAYVNIACYYLFRIPVGLILGYKVDLGVKGIWCGMM